MDITAEEQSYQRQHIQLAALRYYFDRRTLEAHLCSLIEAAHVEQARGMLAGAPIFAVLTRQAAWQVSDHCDRGNWMRSGWRLSYRQWLNFASSRYRLSRRASLDVLGSSTQNSF